MMQLNIFLLIATLLIVKPAVNALFLSRFGAERLPEAFIMVAVTALILSTVYARLLGRIPLNRIIERTLLISFSTLIIFSILLRINFAEGPVLYLFYIWVAIFAVLSSSQFWILANMVYNVREAKRLFSFIGAGAISGGIFGGYLTNILAPLIESENLLFIAALFLLICIPVTRLIWKENMDTLSVFRRKKRMQDLGEHPLKTIRASRHLTYLAGIIGISVIVAKLVDFQFSDVASRAIADPDELAAFFGFWFSTINVVSLVIQLFLTSRVVGVLGVGTSLLFLPAGILAGAALFFVFPELWAVVIIKMADGSFKQSINKSATELLGLPIPFEIKNRTKTFIDVVVDSSATGLAGFILIFIVHGMDLSSRFVSAAIMGLIMLWIYLIYKVRTEYVASFKQKVEATAGGSKNIAGLASPQSVVAGMEKVLRNGSEQQIRYMLRKIREINYEKVFDDVRHLLDHSSAAVRADAVQTLYFFQNRVIVEEVKPLIDDPNMEVKRAAFEYLFEHSSRDTTVLLDTYLDHEDTHIADAALLSLAIETRNNEYLKNKYNLKGRIGAKIEAISLSEESIARKEQKLRLLDVVGFASIVEFNTYIQKALEDEDPAVVRQAIRSAGNTIDPVFIPPLIDFLSARQFRDEARKALINYGLPIIDALAEAVEKRTASIQALRFVPSVIDHFDSQRAVQLLFKLLDDDDYTLRLEATRSLNNLKTSFPELTFNKKEVARRILEEGKLYLNTLSAMHAQIIISYKKKKTEESSEQEKLQGARKSLIELLERRLDGDLERIFRLLGLKYATEDILIAYEGVRSTKPEQRINAIEFLDNLLEPDLKRVLIPIVETTVLDSISEEALRSLSLKIPDEKECFEMLLEGKDQRIKLAVLYLIAQLGQEKYVPVVKPYINSENVKIQTFARKALEKISVN